MSDVVYPSVSSMIIRPFDRIRRGTPHPMKMEQSIHVPPHVVKSRTDLAICNLSAYPSHGHKVFLKCRLQNLTTPQRHAPKAARVLRAPGLSSRAEAQSSRRRWRRRIARSHAAHRGRRGYGARLPCQRIETLMGFRNAVAKSRTRACHAFASFTAPAPLQVAPAQ